jgi:hypothetical protein
MRIPGRKAVTLSGRWLRSRFVPSGLILGYRRVAEVDGWDPFSLSVAPQHFDEHLRVLRDIANPLALQDLVRLGREGSIPRRAMAITFDDGYADSLCVVESLLARYGIPATLFIATDYLGGEFWWDELAGMIAPSRNGRRRCERCEPRPVLPVPLRLVTGPCDPRN